MHKAKTLVIHCIDFRFQEMTDTDVKKRANYGEFDRIAWPGAAKDLENVKSAAEISIRLHDPDEVIIYEHEDCGAYGNDNSNKIHFDNATKLAGALKSGKPTLQTTLLIATFKGIKELQSS